MAKRSAAHRHSVAGYVTFACFLLGSTPEHFERMLGFRTGALRDGCFLYYVDLTGYSAADI